MEHLDDEVVIMNEVSKPPPPPPDEFGRMRREGVQVLEDGSGVRGNRSVDRQNNYKAKSIGPMSRPNQGPSRPLEGLMDTPILGPIGPIRPMDPPMQGPMRDPSSDWRFGRGSGQHPPPPAPQTGPPFLPNIPGHNPLSSSGGMPHPSMPNSVVHMGHNTNDNSLMEPGMNAWNGQAPVPPPPMGPDGLPLKQPITYRLSVLYPPNPAAPPPTTRERPPGCRTVFIGGLPELATQEIVEDVFGKCGDIQSIRMSKKNFCHIRYTQEYCVDNAVYLSGWRMRIDNSCETASTGRLHVDFAQARDDLYEWECMNRSLQREQRHITRVMEDMFRPPSPPPMPHFSDLEAHSITEQIKGDASNFTGALETLLVWLERGDCTKRNAHNFYTMIQAASTHVKRLLGEQAEHEVELARMKEEHRQKMEKLSAQ